MDHFNSTIEDGALVTTRRGFQVSKTKHNGTSFVNVFSGPEQKSIKNKHSKQRGVSEIVDLSQPLEQRFKFVTKPQESQTSGQSLRPKGTPQIVHAGNGDKRKLLKTKLKGNRIVPNHGQLPSPNSTRASSEDSDASLDDALDEFKRCYDGAPFLSMSSWRAEVWATHNYAVPMSLSKQKLLHLYMRYIPIKMYPLENIMSHNPTRSPKFFERLQVTPNSLVSVTMTGSLMEAVIKGQISSDEMLRHESQTCGVINGELRKKGSMRGQEAQGVMECIASMAVGCAHLGRHDHWRIHMKGLTLIINMHGGVDKSWTYVANKVRRANVKGAAVLGTLPYLEYDRMYGSVSDFLPKTTRSRLSNTVKRILARCNVQQVILDSFASLVVFVHAISTALAAEKGKILMDPEAFIEEWLFVEYQFVRYPGALRDESTPIPSVELDLNFGERRYTEPMKRRARYCVPGEVVPAHADNILEPALRIAGLLYVDALVPDEPRTLNGYAVLLGLLATVVDDILTRLAAREARCDDDTADWDDGLPPMAVLKPVMIWIGLTGFIVSWNGDGERFWGLGRYDRTIYRDCLIRIIGTTPESVDRLLDTDLALCRALDARDLLQKDVTTRTVLKTILREHTHGEEFWC